MLQIGTRVLIVGAGRYAGLTGILIRGHDEYSNWDYVVSLGPSQDRVFFMEEELITIPTSATLEQVEALKAICSK